MTAPSRRGLNDTVTRLWSFLAPAYDLPFLQRWVYRPPHDEVIAQLRAHRARKIADIACGTGILSDRIARELQPDEIFGVDMSDGMLARARARTDRVQWLRGPAEQLPFDDGALDAVEFAQRRRLVEEVERRGGHHRVL
ncbi:class I SAM-dependent methyltransferase, partial [Mycobacterium sp. E342]|uniref:class I SAM-dependent methyltransferase n=1 Tax=Mycobacterium sp. E342 TaxID=1834147 RepID=UPI000ABCCEAF